MSDNRMSPDDPLLTAYALGELDPTERETIERQLADSPEAQAAVREIRELAGQLTAELRGAPAPELTEAQRGAILDAAVSPSAVSAAPARSATPSGRRKWLAALAALAATVAVVAIVIPPATEPTDEIAARSTAFDGARSFNGTMGWKVQGQEAEGIVLENALSDRMERAEAERLGAPLARLTTATGLPAGTSGGDQPITAPTNGTLPGGTPTHVLSISEGRREYLYSDGVQGPADSNAPSSPAGAVLADRKNNDQTKDLARGTNRYGGGSRNLATLGERPSSGSGTGGGSGRGGASMEAREEYSSRFAVTAPLDAARQSGRQLRLSIAAESKPTADREEKLSARSSSGEGEATALPRLVQTFNESLRERQFDIADAIAREAKQTAPDSALAELMLHKARANQIGANKALDQRVLEKYGGEITESEYAELTRFNTIEARVGETDYPLLREELAQRRKHRADGYALGTEAYEPIVENPFLSAYESPLSTFGVDVDTASYANVRRYLTQQQLLPPPNAVRIEELVNYFSYDYPQPAGAEPFSVSVDSGPAPWQPRHKLVRIGLKGKEILRDQRPASNLVFLVDVSGSMQPENKLPLVKMGLRLLTQQMTESDRVAIVTYSNTAVQRLESTNGTNREAIINVIESLHADGSTNGAAGIQLAYRAAIEHFIEGGTNRVILCTDGDFNVGVTGDDELVQLIQDRARTKVFFSVFGFGMGNLKDGKLEKLADKGNGHYAYIDSQREAQKMFVDELVGTLVTIAKDVKIQVEFNPNQVGFYRLIGYENRVLASQDFNDDRKDAGEIGAGHTVTALYEIVPAGEAPKPQLGDTLRYRKAVVPQDGALARELLTVKLRYKLPEADASTLIEVPISGDIRDVASESKGVVAQVEAAARDFNWAAAVASFGMLLRDSQFRGQSNFDMVLELAQGAKGDDPSGRRQEFIELVKAAKALSGPVETTPAPPAGPAPVLSREEAEAKATVNGKYRNLLRIVEAPADGASYGAFYDYGHWDGTSYAGHDKLPQGYWVFVAPNWFIWGDAQQDQ